MAEEETYRVYLDGRWELPELADFSRLYYQCYAFVYALERESIDEEYRPFWEVGRAYPWRGGWSSFNYYQILYSRLPPRHRPTLLRIRYASPGFAELQAAIDVAQHVGAAVGLVAGAFMTAEAAYHRIYKHAQERQLLRLDVRLRKVDVSERENQFLATSVKELSDTVGIDPQAILTHAGTPLGALKILLSFYRRVSALARMQVEGKLRLPTKPDE